MKKTFFVLAASSTLITASSCNFKSETEAPKNYYGVESNDDKTPKEAYATLFCVFVGLCVLILWGIKKLKK